jgi:hypothetical protein
MMSIAFGASPPRNGVPRAASSASTMANASSILSGASAMAASLKSSARPISRRQRGNAIAMAARSQAGIPSTTTGSTSRRRGSR